MSKKVPLRDATRNPARLVDNYPYENTNSYSKGVSSNNADSIKMVSSEPKSKCSVSRLLCIQALILLFLLTLAAVVIPIVVLVLELTATSSPCSVTYSQSFVINTIPTAQCTAWQTFTASLNCSSYKLMRIYGSNDQTGITLTDPSVVTAIAVALRYNGTISASSNGVNWRVGSCWWSVPSELTTVGGICGNSYGYTIRPCVAIAGYWGGILTQSFSAASQTLSVHFE